MKTKRLTNFIVTLTLGLFLLGCATHTTEVLEHNKRIEDDKRALVAQYFATQGPIQIAAAQAMSENGETTALVLYAQLAGQQNAAVLEAFKGVAMSLPTNGYDVWNTFMGKTLPTVARWGFGYMLGSDLVEALAAGGAVYNVGGDYTNNAPTLNGNGNLDNTFTLNDTDIDATFNNDGDAALDLNLDNSITGDNNSSTEIPEELE